MRTLIVGAGTMGRWYADVTGDWSDATFLDADLETARRAAAACDASVAETSEPGSFDVVCTAVPMSATPEAIREYGGRAERAVVDLSGSMREPVDAMRTCAPGAERLCLHPLFAPANAPGNVAVVAENAGEISRSLRRCLRDRGYNPFETTVEEHDQAMETVQSKVHAAVIAYALAAEPVEESFQTPVSARMDELVETVLGGDPRVYAEIQARFGGAETLAAHAATIAEADLETLIDLYREAGAGKGRSAGEE